MRIRPVYLIICALLAAVLVALQWQIDRMDAHEPFRRVGLPDPKIPLDETLKWLTAAIQGTEVSYARTLVGRKTQTEERQEEVSYSGCEMTIKIGDMSGETRGYQIAFNLADLAPSDRPIAIVADDGKSYWKVPLHTVEYRDLIRERFGLTNYTSLNVADPQLAQRVINAFDHAARLCQRARKTDAPAAGAGAGASAEKPRPENAPGAGESR